MAAELSPPYQAEPQSSLIKDVTEKTLGPVSVSEAKDMVTMVNNGLDGMITIVTFPHVPPTAISEARFVASSNRINALKRMAGEAKSPKLKALLDKKIEAVSEIRDKTLIQDLESEGINAKEDEHPVRGTGQYL
jgi:hypothetical protein